MAWGFEQGGAASAKECKSSNRCQDEGYQQADALFSVELEGFAFEEQFPLPQLTRIVGHIGGRQEEFVRHDLERLHDAQLQIEGHAGFAGFVARYEAFDRADGVGQVLLAHAAREPPLAHVMQRPSATRLRSSHTCTLWCACGYVNRVDSWNTTKTA